MISLRQAAEITGKSKSTLTRAIKAGRLSASRSTEGIYTIDPAELARVYPPSVEHEADYDAQHGASRNNVTVSDDAALLKLKLALLTGERDRERTFAEREREQLAATVDDLRVRLDRAEQRITALIGNQKPTKRRSWLSWRQREEGN